MSDKEETKLEEVEIEIEISKKLYDQLKVLAGKENMSVDYYASRIIREVSESGFLIPEEK